VGVEETHRVVSQQHDNIKKRRHFAEHRSIPPELKFNSDKEIDRVVLTGTLSEIRYFQVSSDVQKQFHHQESTFRRLRLRLCKPICIKHITSMF
jgi:hypothetical protein